jgi:hypothetical protein
MARTSPSKAAQPPEPAAKAERRKRPRWPATSPKAPSRHALRARRKFLRAFPGGFQDETYLDWERDYKWNAHCRWRDVLSEATFRRMIDERRFQEIASLAIGIESRTNLLFSFEKMALRDAARSPAGAQAFATALFDLLHGDDALEVRFSSWVAAVSRLPRLQTRVLTWPLVTVFGFIAQPATAPELGVLHRRFQHADGLVIDLERHRIGMPVLAAMREREARRIGEAVGRAVHHLGDHRQRRTVRAPTPGVSSSSGNRPGRARRRGQRAVQAAHEHVARAHVVMRRHDEMRQHRLRGAAAVRLPPARELARDAVRARAMQQLELRAARRSARRSVRLTISPWPGRRSRCAARRRSSSALRRASDSAAPARSPFMPCCTTTHLPSSVTMKPCR